MKKIAIILASLFLVLPSYAQNGVEGLLKLLESGRRVSLSFNCRVKGEIPLDLSGTVLAQGDCFHLMANGIESFCDGKTVIMLDSNAKEAYVESAKGLRSYLLANFGALENLELKDVVSKDPSDDLTPFKYELSSLDSSWVVTDLSQGF